MNTTINGNQMRASAESQRHDDPHADARAISRAIHEADVEVRRRFPVLRHQTAIGMGFVALGYIMATVSAWLYLTGHLPAWACILTNAVAFAVLREIEHDLIHGQYFTRKRPLQNLVLFIIWPSLGNVPNPLYRRMIHLQHHRSSGRVEDVEERLLGNGTGFGPIRWFAMLDTGLSLIFRQKELNQIPGFRRGEVLRNLVPVNVLFYFVWVCFLLYHAMSLGLRIAGIAVVLPAGLAAAVAVMNAVAVVWVLPNVIRQASVQVLSSTMHYYGDVENMVQQTQVLSKWYWQPLQLLSCNFGKSHAIHHFVANQPFYLRELVRRRAHQAMREHGVRFDDLGTFKRANRWGGEQTPSGPGMAVRPRSQAQPMAPLQGPEADILFLKLQGRLDAVNAPEFEERLHKSIEAGVRRVSIDFSELNYISASGLRVLLRAARKLMHLNGRMALHSLNYEVRNAFRLSGISSIFTLHRTERGAVAELSSRGLSTNGFTTFGCSTCGAVTAAFKTV